MMDCKPEVVWKG